MPIVLKSLKSITDFDNPSDRYELIVDNVSTDGSFEEIKKSLEKRAVLGRRLSA